MKNKDNKEVAYLPEVCPHCNMTLTYVLAIDQGTVDILKAVARAINVKGVNVIHPRKEIEGKMLSSNQVGNLSRPRFHGLIARVKGNPGNYLLTKKGADFLRGQSIPKFAIISKAMGKQIGYYEEEKNQVNIRDFPNKDQYWTGINYTIEAGNVVRDPVANPNRPVFGSKQTLPVANMTVKKNHWD